MGPFLADTLQPGTGLLESWPRASKPRQPSHSVTPPISTDQTADQTADEPREQAPTSGLGCRGQAPEADGQQQAFSLGMPGGPPVSSALRATIGTASACFGSGSRRQGLGRGPVARRRGRARQPPHKTTSHRKNTSYFSSVLKFVGASLVNPSGGERPEKTLLQKVDRAVFRFYSTAFNHPCFSPEPMLDAFSRAVVSADRKNRQPSG